MGVYERFGEYYDLIYKEMVNYEKETDVLEELFQKFCTKKPQTVLDIGCGTGSQALILSARDYKVTGIDISKTMIERARKKAEREKSKVEFLVQDMRNLKLEKKYDCATCMFGGFGYITTYQGLVGLFSGLKQCLNKDGLFIYELWNIGGVLPTPYQTWMRKQNDDFTLYRLSESNFDPATNILNIDMHFIVVNKDRSAEMFSEAHKIRCYTLAEMKQYLEDNSFNPIAAYDWNVEGETQFKSPQRNAFRILAVAKRS